MRESEEIINQNKWWTDEGCYVNEEVISTDYAEHAVKLAYKEGYLEAIDKLTKKFKELQERHWMCTYKDVLYVIDNIDK